jgi:predicted flap endonuclease-1-like 5' DNA nuclease
MIHYYTELATYALLVYLLGCMLGAFVRKYFAAEPDYQYAGPAMAETFVAPVAPITTVAHVEKTVVAKIAAPPIVTSIRQPAPVIPPTHPSLPRIEPDTRMSRPRGIAAPLGGKADDLLKIVGVGPKYEKLLHNLGFFHFDQIAEWTPEQVAWVDDHLKFDGRIEREHWIDQARLLADGDMQEFNRLYGSGAAKSDKPKGMASARGGKADDLKRISGIGPKNEKVLHSLGVFHFDQIAAWSEDEMAWVDSHLKFNGRIAREEWTRQAKLLADGNESEFKRLYGTGGMKDAKGDTQSGARTRKG